MSRSPQRSIAATRNMSYAHTSSMNNSHDFWKEKMEREVKNIPTHELQSLRMLMHEGQSYLGLSRRMKKYNHMRHLSEEDSYNNNLGSIANSYQKYLDNDPFRSKASKI